MSKWTPQENIHLIQKADEYKHKWTKVSPEFPNRSTKSLQSHYAILKKSNFCVDSSIDKIDLTIKENCVDFIKKILEKKITDSEKINQLQKFNTNDVFQEIINLSLEHPSSSPFLSILLQKMFENTKFPKMIFLSEVKNKECMTLLHFCRSFSVIKDEEFENIDYVQNDSFFFNGPVFEKSSRKDICAAARKEKKEKSVDNTKDLQIENARQSKTIIELTQKIELLKEKVEYFTNQLFFNSKSSEKKEHLSSESEIILPKKLLIKYPMLLCMVNKFLNKPTGADYHKFCSLINILNSKTYIRLRDFMPLLSLSTCHDFIKPIKISIIDMILNHEYIPSILYKFYNGMIKFGEDVKAEKPICVCLGGDAASLKNFTKSSSLAVYAYQMCPLMKDYPPCVVHLTESQNGSSPQKVVDMFPKIKNVLSNHNFIVKFQATDGDRAFDGTHRTFFTKHVEPIIDSKFIEIVDKVFKEDLLLLVSDPMHLIKCAKSRLLQHLLLIDPDTCKCVNTALFSQAVELGPVFADRSTSGSMKDNYALAMFSWYSLVTVLEKGRFDAAYYVLSYFFFSLKLFDLLFFLMRADWNFYLILMKSSKIIYK